MVLNRELDLSNDLLSYRRILGDSVKWESFHLKNGSSWLHSTAQEEFIICVDGEMVTNLSDGIMVKEIFNDTSNQDLQNVVIRMEYVPKQLLIDVHSIVYPETALIEKWVVINNLGVKTVKVDRIDSFSLHIPEENYEMFYFTSKWGEEFEPVHEKLSPSNNHILETRAGRSSQHYHPWVTLQRSNGELLTLSVAWSGNWILRIEHLFSGGYRLSGGLNDWEFHKQLDPAESIEGVRVVMALGQKGNITDTAKQYQFVGRNYWYPSNYLSRHLPVEWNHWWPYEDKEINENSFKENVNVAQKLGIDLCTLDAGWFGPSSHDSHWYDYRGDWGVVNVERFPKGIRALSDYVHERGMKFGLWCEIEALGRHANLAKKHPEFSADRDGKPIGYLCFGCKQTQEWAFLTLDRLITDYDCDWIKLDFNLDPGAGCNRTDHGHGSGDGLYEHYMGYYRVLDRIREKHPHVLLENCASGGLRIDLGIMRHTHMTFLSDPDWPEHDLQVFWGATTMLSPNVCLHWMYSQWLGNHPRQKFNPHNVNLAQHQLDYYIRISMLNGFGFSQRLPELPNWIQERIAWHIRLYKETVREFIRHANVYHLTEQSLRNYEGDRWAGFQYSKSKSEQLVFVFRLDESKSNRTIRLLNLDSHKVYTVSWLTDRRIVQRTGKELMDEGLTFTELKEEDSAIILLSCES